MVTIMERSFTLQAVLLLAVVGQVTRGARIALFITDVQKCFTSGGTLAVKDADDIIDVINDIRNKHGDFFDLVVHSQDWHCPDHVSFASQYPTHGVYDVIELDYNAQGQLCKRAEVQAEYATSCTASDIRHRLNQTLWPNHCIKHTEDAEFHPRLLKLNSDIVVQKGYHCYIDSYSMFYDNGEFSQTDLRKILEDENIDTLFMTGLALDYCVFWTAREARDKFDYDTYLILDATKPVDVKTGELAKDDMLRRGVKLIRSDDVGDLLRKIKSGAAPMSTNLMLIISALFIMITLI